jgi:hypothetical protein
MTVPVADSGTCTACVCAYARALRLLEVLEMRNNALTTLPAELSELHMLQKLDFSYNKLSALPTELHLLTNLTVRVPPPQYTHTYTKHERAHTHTKHEHTHTHTHKA